MQHPQQAAPTGPWPNLPDLLLAEGSVNDESWRDALAVLRMIVDEIPGPSAPDRLFGRPCPVPAARWHLQQLEGLHRETGAPPLSPAEQARLIYHRRMLAYLVAPQENRNRPLVTILIPTYNRATLLPDAVRSCLEQSWRPIEILVIDDGSEQDVAAALQTFGDAVRLHRKPHGGVASARNLGIRLARGEFVHFLDSDDLLLPHAIERNVGAFAAIPDATLCFGMALERNLPGVAVPKIRVPNGTDHCATSDFLAAAISRCPFFTPTVMMPRWAMLAAHPFEEDLPRGEDTRYWFRLGLAGVKAIGHAEPLIIRRVVPDGLSVTPNVGESALVLRVRNLRDLILSPAVWPHAGSVLLQVMRKMEDADNVSPQPLRDILARERLVSTLADLGDGRARDGLSPVPLLADLRNRLEVAHGVVPSERVLSILHEVREVMSAALKSAAPLTSRDVAYWADGSTRARRNTSIGNLFRVLAKLSARDPDLPKRIDPVLRRCCPSPAAQTVKRYRKLRRRLRSGALAARLTWRSAYWIRRQ
ncbi:glycosyltransferase family A protein [Dongia deserti]|uniref:glycosyltransferase family A protein n=1 Tax=Dongia deserti TaxID=2268030 RepID=UPI000E64983B|nr:glycosyltransferase family 2 protein [Dongia deserti]